jgi:16S rRNA (cytidine1402-2'-O)-methyltransferase
MFEQTVNGSLAELLHYFSTHPIKGEFVIVVEGKK